MQCDYFGECGSCTLYDRPYEETLHFKANKIGQDFSAYYDQKLTLFASPPEHFRFRAEFRIWHEGDTISYAMTNSAKNGVVSIDSCKIVSPDIYALMPKLLEYIKAHDMCHKLFHIDFLNTLSGQMVVTLIYHKALDEAWHEKALVLASTFDIRIIGRSKKQKRVIGADFVTEALPLKNKTYYFEHIENSFTQPNARVNIDMITWTQNHAQNLEGDLVELYCGAGNFTIPLSGYFDKILATEISKASIKAARKNCLLNSVDNITFLRMSSQEFVDAINKVRPFTRLEGIDLNSFDAKTIFIDPPRSGLDEITRKLVVTFDTIIYISCNPNTLLDDLKVLSVTHTVKDMALFDQFAYTHHAEVGVLLKAK